MWSSHVAIFSTELDTGVRFYFAFFFPPTTFTCGFYVYNFKYGQYFMVLFRQSHLSFKVKERLE